MRLLIFVFMILGTFASLATNSSLIGRYKFSKNIIGGCFGFTQKYNSDNILIIGINDNRSLYIARHVPAIGNHKGAFVKRNSKDIPFFYSKRGIGTFITKITKSLRKGMLLVSKSQFFNENKGLYVSQRYKHTGSSYGNTIANGTFQLRGHQLIADFRATSDAYGLQTGKCIFEKI